MSWAMDQLGERLREERLRLNLKQEALADSAGISTNSLGAYERGRTEMKVPVLLKFRDIGIDIGYVLTASRTSNSIDDIELRLINLLGRLSFREREAVLALVSKLAGEQADENSPALDKVPDTLHAPGREFRGQRSKFVAGTENSR